MVLTCPHSASLQQRLAWVPTGLGAVKPGITTAHAFHAPVTPTPSPQVVESFGCNLVEGVMTHEMKQFIIDGNKCVLHKPSPESKVDMGQVYCCVLICMHMQGKQASTLACSLATVLNRLAFNAHPSSEQPYRSMQPTYLQLHVPALVRALHSRTGQCTPALARALHVDEEARVQNGHKAAFTQSGTASLRVEKYTGGYVWAHSFQR